MSVVGSWKPSERVVRAAAEAGVAAWFAALAVWATRPLVFAPGELMLNGPDPAIYVWLVDWVSGHLLSREAFEGNLFHPVRHAVLLSDLAFTSCLLAAPLRPFLHDPVLLCNLAILLTLATGGWAFHHLVRSLTGNRSAGVLAGTVAAFGSHQVLHVYQLALVNVAFLALLLLALHGLVRRPGARAATFAAVVFALNAMSSGYYAVASPALALLFAAVHWREMRRREVFLSALGAAALAAVLLLPFVLTFADLQATENVARDISLSRDQRFDPARDVTSGTYLYGALLGSEGQRLFPGLLVLALAAVAVVRRAPHSVFFAAAVPLMLALSLGPEVDVGGARITLPYAFLFAHRPFDAMQHPYTFAAVAVFCLCVLAGLGWAGLPVASRRLAVPAALLVAFVEIAGPPVVVRHVPRGLPIVYRALDALPPGTVLEVPSESWDAMVYAARHGRPVLNGASGLAPEPHARLERWIRHDWLATRNAKDLDVDASRPMRQLLKMDATYVVVPGRTRELRRLQGALDASRVLERVNVPGVDALYRRAASPNPVARPLL